MSDRKFDILLKRDRNWLSRYGGFISLALIILLVIGILKIQIPKYQSLVIDSENQNIARVELSSDNESFHIGDFVDVETIEKVTFNLEVVSIDNKENTRYMSLKVSNGESISDFQDLRIIVNKSSLLESIVGSFIK